MIVSYSLLGWGLGRCVSFVVLGVVLSVVLGLISVAGAMLLGFVAMGVPSWIVWVVLDWKVLYWSCKQGVVWFLCLVPWGWVWLKWGVLIWFVWAVLHSVFFCWIGRQGFVELSDVQVWSRVVVGFSVVSWFHLQAFFCAYRIVCISL